MSDSNEEKNIIENSIDTFKDKLEKTNENISTGFNKGVKTMGNFLRKLFFGVLILAVLAGVGYFLWANYTYSEGTRSGQLIKISKRGMVFKTYEGQLKLGGIDLSNTDEGLSDTWSFSVSNKEIAEELEVLQGQKVILHYKEIKQAMPWQGDTNYFIKKIEKVR